MAHNDDDSHSEQVHRLNQMLYEELKTYLERDGTNMFTFFDLEKMSEGVLPFWHNGAHITAEGSKWYLHVIYNILLTLCPRSADVARL